MFAFVDGWRSCLEKRLANLFRCPGKVIPICLQAQFCVESERKIEHVPSGKEIGIDVGLKSFLTASEGNTVANPRHYRKAEKKLKRLGRRLSRTQKKSANRKKARKALAKQHLKVQRQREDFARKEANALVSSCDLIAYETLQIRNIVRNRTLAKSIHDAGWR